MTKLLRKWLILSHRYAGIVLSLFVVMWFVTGITMMYVGGMPRLTPELRLDKLPNLDLGRVRLTPAEAAEAGLVDSPGRTLLLSIMGRPAYRFGVGDTTTVFADTGDVMDGASVAQSRTIASRFAGVNEDQVEHAGTLTNVDQWTLVQSRQLPLDKFRVNDDSGTELYVSPATGEVTMVTTRRGRALAWVSTIPHFFYFAALRENQPVWYQFVVWSSGLVCALAVLGLVLGCRAVLAQQVCRAQCAGTTSPAWSSACSPLPGPSAGCSRWSHLRGPTPSRSRYAETCSPEAPSISPASAR